MTYRDLTIVINTFNSDEIINSCIKSIESNYKIFIIENSTNQKLKETLEKKYKNVNCYLTGKNLGYAKGNNFGLSKVTTKYALILNPDATLESDTITNFFKSAEIIKNFAILGPAKQDEFKKEDLVDSRNDIVETDHIKGFAMFFNLEQFKDIGFFDDSFFIYLEEIDLCKRLRKNGKKIFLDKKIKINHLGGSSHNKSVDFEMELSRNWHWMWSTFYYNKKHYGYLNALFKTSGKFFSSSLKVIFYTLTFNRKKRKIYFQRFSGLLHSIIGNKSWYRPNIITN